MKKKNPKIDMRKYEVPSEGKKLYFVPLLKRLATRSEVQLDKNKKSKTSKKKNKAKI